jgi:peptidoglycan-associated lipoprotein
MKTLIKQFSITFLSLILSFSGFSQKKNKNLIKADEAFENHEYFSAITLYKQALSGSPDETKGYIFFRAGEASQEINDYKEAESYFQKAIKANYTEPLVYFKLAEVLKIESKYDEAVIEYKNYKTKGGEAKKADRGISSCQLAKKYSENPTRYQIENMALINSKGRDYCASFSDKSNKTIVFSSNREGSLGDIDITTGKNKSDIYETKVDKNLKWSTPVLLPPAISTEVNEGQPWVSKKGDMIFFTRCPESKGKKSKCGLYMAKKQGSTWGDAELLPFNNDTVQFGHPCLSSDGKILYLSSRKAGGYGGADIWSCTFDVKKAEWGQLKNAGSEVNTSGNEVFPTLSDDGKHLYFSSDYHPGLGGLDIFEAEAGIDGKYTKHVVNMKAPINSAFDDFSLIFEGKKQKGFFTSNREGGKGDDDIWGFNLPPLVFSGKGNVFCEGDPKTGKGKNEPVEAVKVLIIGSDGSISESITGKDGSYTFKLKEKTTYTVSTETSKLSKSASFAKDGFLANKDHRFFQTVGEDHSKEFKADFFVKPVVPDLRMPEIQYALGSAKLLPESKDSLNYLFNILKDNPTIVCELSAHTDNQGKAASNFTLSEARAQSCVDYLVIEKNIPAARLVAKGFGQTKLIVSDELIKAAKSKEEKDALHQKNRRTEFKVLNFNYVDASSPKTPLKTNKPKTEEEEE